MARERFFGRGFEVAPAQLQEKTEAPDAEPSIECEVPRIRAELMGVVRDYIRANGLTQQQAAERFAVKQPRISEIVQGKTGLFTTDKLIELLNRVGMQVEISVLQPERGDVSDDSNAD